MTGSKAPKAHANVRIAFQSRRQMLAVARALNPEAMHPAGRKAQARIVSRGKTLRLSFEAKDTSTLRAIVSSYLRLLAASLNVCKSLLQLERSAADSRRDKS